MNRGQSSSGLDTSTPIFQSLAFVNFIHRHQPNLCNACINLASIFDESTETSRDLDKQGSSSIKHHDSLTSLLVCKRTCPLCALILAAVPYRTEWFLWEIARDILVVEYKSAKVTSQADSWDRDGWLFQNLSEWKKRLANPKLKATPKTAKITSWTNQYNRRLVQVGLPKTVPLYEILNGMQAETGQLSMMLKINKWSQAIRIREHYTTKGQLADFALALQTERGSGLRTLSSGTLRISSSPDNLGASLVPGRLVPAGAGTLKSLGVAKGWIEACFHDHSECHWSTKNEDPLLPTRVIDVQGPDQDVVLLISSEGKRGKWLALSHRWPRGIGQIVSLCQDNIQSFENGILVESLPSTFRDAIKVTRFLGLRYLWIDSLCIVQDSPRDWDVEASKMPGIYQNAYVTLAAAATEDSHGGMFVFRAWGKRSIACEIPIKGPYEGTVTIHLPLEHGLQQEETNYLDNRAWCFQESRLSHRLLTFDRLQMSYTCLRHGLLESREVPDAAAREEKNSFLPKLYAASGNDDQSREQELLITWYQAVSDYTSRSLTFQKDKLVAIAGMARIVGDFMKDEYYAGLWKRNLPQALLWSPYEEETFPNAPHKASLPSSYRAPSWSWASVESPISNFLCRQALGRETHAQITSIVTTLKGPDPHGQVKFGYLNISAPFLEAKIGTASSRWPYQPNILPLNSHPPFPEYSIQNQIEEDSKLGHAIFDLEWLKQGTKIWLLQITDVYGLILCPVNSNNSEIFSRVGVFHLAKEGRLGDVSEVKII